MVATKNKLTAGKKPKALLLLSGGIDSPVAGLLAQKKFEVQVIHFSQAPFTDDSPSRDFSGLPGVISHQS